jgi:hypothetical protein
VLDLRLATLLCKEIIVVKSKEVKSGWSNLAAQKGLFCHWYRHSLISLRGNHCNKKEKQFTLEKILNLAVMHLKTSLDLSDENGMSAEVQELSLNILAT